MPYLRPTLAELRQEAFDDLTTAPGGDGMGLLRRAVSRVLAWALGNAAHGHHGHLDWIAKQSNPFSATDEYLEAWAGLIGVYRKPGVAWIGTATWSASVPATVLPAGTGVSGPDGGVYVTVSDATVGSDGIVIASALAMLTGSASGLDVGSALTITGGVAGISGSGVVTAVVQPGIDVELDDPFRTRMLQRWAAPPQGGAAQDYLEWALAVPGVTRAWVNPNGAGAGTVVVYSMWDLAEAVNAGFPQGTDGVAGTEVRGRAATGDQLIVANAIYPLRPVTSLVLSVSPISYHLFFVIHPRTAVPAAVQASVVAAINDTFLALASPLAEELELDAFETAIAAVPGMPRFTLVSPAGPINAPLGHLPVLGGVSYA